MDTLETNMHEIKVLASDADQAFERFRTDDLQFKDRVEATLATHSQTLATLAQTTTAQSRDIAALKDMVTAQTQSIAALMPTTTALSQSFNAFSAQTIRTLQELKEDIAEFKGTEDRP